MKALVTLARGVVDVRVGEGTTLARAAGALFVIVTAHAMLETARDALLLTRFPARDLGAVYVVAALTVLPVAALTSRLGGQLGPRKTLAAGLILAAGALGLLFAAPLRTGSVIGVYVISGLFGAVLMPVFWNLVGSVFTVAEGRRLLSVVAAAGTLGAVVGSSASAALIGLVPLSALLPISASLALTATLLLPVTPGEVSSPSPEPPPELTTSRASDGIMSDPFVRRVALLTATTTIAAVVVDFFFKWTVSRSVPTAEVARFVARYYAMANGAAIVAQLAASRAVIRRRGLVLTMLVTPLLVGVGAVGVLISGGAVVAVLALKALDTALRSSVYRTTVELSYLPLPTPTRMRVKPLIDGAVVRAVQVVAGASLFALGVRGHVSVGLLGWVTLGATALWLLAASSIQRPYVALLRRAIAGGNLEHSLALDPLDLESAEALIGHLSSDDPLTVIGAVNALTRRGRERLIPGLMLLHADESVLVRILSVLASSDRKDWITYGRRLLADGRDIVRMAAARALAARGVLTSQDLPEDPNPRVRGYATFHLALEHGNPAFDPSITEIVDRQGVPGEEERLGVLSAVADAPPDERLLPLLGILASRLGTSRDASVELSRAVTSQRAVALIPALIPRLTIRSGRDAVRTALMSFDDDAVNALQASLVDCSSPRELRIHIPNTLRRFGNRRAAELLVGIIETDLDGLVRYKALRALGRLVAERDIKVDRQRIERLALHNLLEYFRLLGLRACFDRESSDVTAIRLDRTERILIGILDDKLRQSLERTFRLLKIAHPHEDIHRVHAAYLSDDKRARANAAEFLDALTRDAKQSDLSRLLHIAADEPSINDAIARAREILPEAPPATRAEALTRLSADADSTLSALARQHVGALTGPSESAAIHPLADGPIEHDLSRSRERKAVDHA